MPQEGFEPPTPSLQILSLGLSSISFHWESFPNCLILLTPACYLVSAHFLPFPFWWRPGGDRAFKISKRAKSTLWPRASSVTRRPSAPARWHGKGRAGRRQNLHPRIPLRRRRPQRPEARADARALRPDDGRPGAGRPRSTRLRPHPPSAKTRRARKRSQRAALTVATLIDQFIEGHAGKLKPNSPGRPINARSTSSRPPTARTRPRG